MNVKLIWVTPDAENIMAYCARVSSPHQDNPEYSGLLRYCVENEHWSVFEMASLCVEITTSRAISAQILRHRSFSFQEFSQRYAEVTDIEKYQARRQAAKNRQSSVDDMSDDEKQWFDEAQHTVQSCSLRLYYKAIEKGIAKEQARFLLPMATSTRLYMTGSVRSWIHYLRLRTKPNAQLEHRDIARAIKVIFCEQLPTVGGLL